MDNEGMTGGSMAVVTPSYSQDYELCADLAKSVRRYARPEIEHHIIVPRSDISLFKALSRPTTKIHSVDEYLPRSFRRLPWVNGWVNMRRPFPPIRGWIAQQITKLCAVAALDVDIALLVDSDMMMIRPFGASDFQNDGRPAMFRLKDAITEQNLPRHVLWHEVAQRMLGIDPKAPPFADYIAWPCAWQPSVCRGLLGRIKSIAGNQSWETVVGRELHFSEMILYGVYADRIYDPDERKLARVDKMNCATYGAQQPLDIDGLRHFLAGVSANDVAVMISAKSGTPIGFRRQAWAELSPSEHSIEDRLE